VAPLFISIVSDEFFFLDQLVRQASDPEFGEFLQRVREGKIAKPDFDFLMSRCVTNTDSLSADSTMLLATNRAVDALNRHRLQQHKSAANPVCIINAMQSNSAEQQELNLFQQQKSRSPLKLLIGARVMLLRSISVRHGLVNGAIGILRSICYQAGCKPPQLPTCVFVEFDGYSGPALLDSDGHRVVPIMPMNIEAGTQLPLQLAWAITVHKSQGLTLKEAYFDFRSIVRASDGLVYTALTRVKQLSDLHVSWCSLPELTKFLKTSKPLLDELKRLREMSISFH
jgi:ATP-dependent exoDNAse (exonuclease V) alpha subunit